MKFKLKELNICYWPETIDMWDVVEVNQIKDNEDQLKFNDQAYNTFLDEAVDNPDINYDKYDNIANKVEKNVTNTLNYINSSLDKLMDIKLFDKWTVDIDDWQDTLYLKEVSWEINKVVKEFVEWEEKAKNNLDDRLAVFVNKLTNIEIKATSAENLKWFLNKLEEKKSESTLDNIASSSSIWKKLISHREKLNRPEDMLAAAEKNAGHVNF